VVLVGRAPADPTLKLPRSLELTRRVYRTDAGYLVRFRKGQGSGTAKVVERGVELEGRLLPFAEWAPGEAEPSRSAVLELSGSVDLKTLVRGIATLQHAGYATVLPQAE
jgi:hypothetical protein